MTDAPAQTRRTGARTVASVPREVLRRLNAGELETASLAEMLAMDLGALLRAVDPRAGPADIARLRTGGIVARLRAGGAVLFEHHGPAAMRAFAGHRSDMVRAFACFMLAADPKPTLRLRLERIRPLADDPHSGVREWAWLAVRDAVAADPVDAVRLLTHWTDEPSANLRRFASEATRPRGVWCAHINLLKNEPAIGLPILEPLRADPSKYVQDSVANWLNDAGKSRPAWVRSLCARWSKERRPDHAAAAAARIVTRATRNL